MSNLQTSSSKIPPHMVAWLSAEGWTAEDLSFIEQHKRKLRMEAVEELDRLSLEKVRKAIKIHARQEAQKGERAREYDSKNNYQGKDSPEWFRASIDRDLFK